MRNYHHLTLGQRYQISALLQAKISYRSIAQIVGCHVSTISRELKRNLRIYTYSRRTIKQYRPQVAHNKAGKRKRHPSFVLEAVWVRVRECLQQYWSPEQISNRLRLYEGLMVSHESIYRYIRRNKELSVCLRMHKHRRYRQGSSRISIANRVSISERPAIVEERSRIGDWELDSMSGLRAKQDHALITLVDRKSRYLFMRLIHRKTSSVVSHAIISMLRDYKAFTLTSDNGSEFAGHKEISEALGADFYFAHPYSSWERGTNENTNGLIRQYFPKKTDFAHVTDEQVAEVEALLNNRPRACLGWKAPSEVFFDQNVALDL